jgi:ferric-dicitrate binding protein FerR (iron transport regulator)
MKTFGCILIWLAALALTASGCATSAAGYAPAYELPPIREGTLGRLAVDGPNAYLNGERVSSGRYVMSGDTVTTGPGTSAMLLLNAGGYVQLDENTDPLFREGLCLLIKVLHGQVLFSNVKCQQVEAGANLAFVAHSVVNLKASDEETRVTVLDGQVDMTRPGKATLGRYAEYLVIPNAAPLVTQLTPEQAATRVAWQQRYFRVNASQAPDRVSPAGAAAVGAFLGGIFGFTQRDHGRPAPPSNTRDGPAAGR